MLVFDYLDYKNYILDYIESQPSKGRGYRLKLSKSLGCQTAFISQVLNQETHFSLEQAINVSSFVGHSSQEREYFLLLIQYARAGSFELKKYFLDQLNNIVEKRKELENRIDISDRLEEKNQHIYYSVWYYAAIHILTSIPEFQTPLAISKRLSLPIKLVNEVLEFLTSTGLCELNKNKYSIGKTRIHLSKSSVEIRRHHQNWRTKSVNSIDQNREEDFHYSNIISISKEDIPKVREVLLQSIESAREIIKVSPEEELQALTIDFFSV